MPSEKVKVIAASVGAGAVIAMGALGATFAAGPSGSETIGKAPEATLGETTTQQVGVTEIQTPVATPEVTATPAPEA